MRALHDRPRVCAQGRAPPGVGTRCKHILWFRDALAGLILDHPMAHDCKAVGGSKETAGLADWPLKPGWSV